MVKRGSESIDYFLNTGIFLENGIVRKSKDSMMDIEMYSLSSDKSWTYFKISNPIISRIGLPAALLSEQ